MKRSLALRSFLFGSAIAALPTSPAAFAGNIWDGGGGSGLWNTDANWNLDTPPSTGVALTFAGNVQNSTSNDILAVDPSFAGILFTNSGAASNTNAFTLAGSRITLGGDITTTANTAGATITDIISLNMILSGNRIITTNQQSATVQHNLTISGIISEDVAGRTLTKAGSGILTLSGANTYTGGTSVAGGTLTANNLSALGIGAVTLSGSANLNLGATGTYNNNITAGGGSTIYPSQNRTVTYGGTVTLNGTGGTAAGATLPTGPAGVTFSSFSATNTHTFNNAIGGTGDLVIRGGGAAANHNHTYILKGGASTYTGNTWLYGSSTLPIASGGTNIIVKLDGGALPSTTVLTMTQNNAGVLNNSVLDLNGNNQTLAGLTNITIGTGGSGWFVSNTHASVASTLTINNSESYTFGGVIGVNTTTATTGQTAGAGNIALTKIGTGTLTLSGATANTYTGLTKVSGGTLELNKSAGNAIGTNNVGLTINTGGTVQYNAAAAADQLWNQTVVTVAGGTFNMNNKADVVGRLIYNSGTISNVAGPLVLAGAGLEVLSMRDTTIGFAVNINSNSATALGVTFDATNNGTATINGDINININAALGTSRTFTIGNGTAATDMIINGVIKNTVSGGLIKAGAGTLALTNDNTYGGATAVNFGTLLVNNTTGSGTGGGAVTVASGAALGGNGTVGGSATFNDSSIFAWNLSVTTPANTGSATVADTFSVTGDLTDGGANGGSVFKILLAGNQTFADNFWTANQSWNDVLTSGNVVPVALQDLFTSFSYENVDGTISPTGYGSFTLSGSTLSWQAVPEPSTALAGLLLTAGLLRRRRL